MMVQDEALLVLVAAVVVEAAAWDVLRGNLEIGFARGQAAMNTTSQAGQNVSGATPQRNRPLIHPTSPNFLHHLQENGRVRRDKTSEEPKQDNDHLSRDFFSFCLFVSFHIS
ncbi:unnamed protein product [Eruca vesicaria subsp. sativa]|uniref:Secreted protein n=1 Tax=Eruca vesicaria subsp. sativa TaxID=29727 RepID=A0ABC8JVV7_ERUVS|nr:unnamed protein product [Eruca vesicaria subsp. sativa]